MIEIVKDKTVLFQDTVESIPCGSAFLIDNDHSFYRKLNLEGTLETVFAGLDGIPVVGERYGEIYLLNPERKVQKVKISYQAIVNVKEANVQCDSVSLGNCVMLIGSNNVYYRLLKPYQKIDLTKVIHPSKRLAQSLEEDGKVYTMIQSLPVKPIKVQSTIELIL